jgi:hypothetical protein
MRKKKVNQEDRISKLEKVVSQLYITQMEIINRITPKENEE